MNFKSIWAAEKNFSKISRAGLTKVDALGVKMGQKLVLELDAENVLKNDWPLVQWKSVKVEPTWSKALWPISGFMFIAGMPLVLWGSPIGLGLIGALPVHWFLKSIGKLTRKKYLPEKQIYAVDVKDAPLEALEIEVTTSDKESMKRYLQEKSMSEGLEGNSMGSEFTEYVFRKQEPKAAQQFILDLVIGELNPLVEKFDQWYTEVEASPEKSRHFKEISDRSVQAHRKELTRALADFRKAIYMGPYEGVEQNKRLMDWLQAFKEFALNWEQKRSLLNQPMLGLVKEQKNEWALEEQEPKPTLETPMSPDEWVELNIIPDHPPLDRFAEGPQETIEPGSLVQRKRGPGS